MQVEKCPRCTKCEINMVHDKFYPCYVCPQCGCVATENWTDNRARREAKRIEKEGKGK